MIWLISNFDFWIRSGNNIFNTLGCHLNILVEHVVCKVCVIYVSIYLTALTCKICSVDARCTDATKCFVLFCRGRLEISTKDSSQIALSEMPYFHHERQHTFIYKIHVYHLRHCLRHRLLSLTGQLIPVEK